MAFKASPEFCAVIKRALDLRAEQDSVFKEKLQNKGKSIEECCEFIASQVHKSGYTMLSEEEVYGIAAHYYDEEELEKWEKAPSGSVVVPNYKELEAEISEARKAELKQIAEEQYISKHRAEMEKAKIKSAAKPKKQVDKLPFVEQTLF